MFDINELTRSLSGIAKKLSKGDALNYSVSFGLYKVNGAKDLDFDAILKAGLGEKAGLGGTRSASVHEVLDEVRQALVYTGDDGSHPNRKYLSSDRFASDVDEIIQQIDSLCTSADVIAEIRLNDWHPFYPVFWDLAFLFVIKDNAVILIGSSSD